MRLLGIHRDHTGGVFVIDVEMPNFRKSERWMTQVKLEQFPFDADKVFALDRKSVLLSTDGNRLLAPDASLWKVSPHVAVYRKRWS